MKLPQIGMQPMTTIEASRPSTFAAVSVAATPSMAGDQFILAKPLSTPAPAEPMPSEPLSARIWRTVRAVGLFAVPTAVGAGIGLGIAAAAGTSLGVGALIGGGIGLAAIAGGFVYAMRNWLSH